jgi:hypothetical protein
VFTTCGAHHNLICLFVCVFATKRIFFCRPLNLKWKIDSRPPLLNYYNTKILNLDIIVKFRILKIMKLRDFLRLCPSVCLSVHGLFLIRILLKFNKHKTYYFKKSFNNQILSKKKNLFANCEKCNPFGSRSEKKRETDDLFARREKKR